MMTLLVQRLQQQGLVSRERHADDGPLTAATETLAQLVLLLQQGPTS